MEDIPYIATLDHITVALGQPIGKTVSTYLKGDPDGLTVKELIDYLLKPDENWKTDQRNISNIIEENQIQVREHTNELFLGIKLRTPDGEFRNIPENLQRKGNEGIVFLVETAKAVPLFDRYQGTEHQYMGLNMVVTGAESGGKS